MKDDDPEKRIRELEQQLASGTQAPQAAPTYTDGATYTENPSQYPGGPTYTAGPTYPGGPPYGFGAPPPRRTKRYPWFLVPVLLAVILPTFISLVMFFARSTSSPSISIGGGARTTTTSRGPTAVPQGGELRLGENSQTRTIACNGGKLTFAGFDDKYIVTGHCAGLIVGGYNNDVTVDSTDSLESTGYTNTITDRACDNTNVKLSSYGIVFKASGHCAALNISSYDNNVTVDSVDTITVSGYNNAVTYHSGTPKVTNSGYDNTIQRG